MSLWLTLGLFLWQTCHNNIIIVFSSKNADMKRKYQLILNSTYPICHTIVWLDTKLQSGRYTKYMHVRKDRHQACILIITTTTIYSLYWAPGENYEVPSLNPWNSKAVSFHMCWFLGQQVHRCLYYIIIQLWTKHWTWTQCL